MYEVTRYENINPLKDSMEKKKALGRNFRVNNQKEKRDSFLIRELLE